MDCFDEEEAAKHIDNQLKHMLGDKYDKVDLSTPILAKLAKSYCLIVLGG